MSELKVDLSSLQEVWAWDGNKSCGVKGVLVDITDKAFKFIVYNKDEMELFKFINCEPYNNQDKPKMRPMTDAEVFKAIRDGAVICDDIRGCITNYWSLECNISEFTICYNFTGEDDKWEKMEVEV